MSIEIKEIKAIKTIKCNVQLCHLDKTNWSTLEWKMIPRKAPIWKEGKKMWPAAFVFGKKAQLQVDIDFTISDKEVTGEYTLIGCYLDYMNKISLSTVVFKGIFKIDGINNPVTVTVYDCNPNDTEYFQGIQGNFTWQVVPGNLMQDSEPPPGQKTDKETENSNNDNSHTTSLELYWLTCDPGKKDPKLFKNGIPVEILQQVNITYQLNEETQDILSSMDPLPPGMKYERPNLPPSSLLISNVVNACFYRNPPGYCISYSNNYFTNNSYNIISLKLRKYLSSINNLDQSCNCVDMAAVLQLYLKALGIADVKFSVLQPFGYLKVTGLIGRGFSNNPFYGKSQGEKIFGEKGVTIVIRENQDRTYFGLHAFCILLEKGNSKSPCDKCCHNNLGGNRNKISCENEKIETYECNVLDSCAGPHTGYETMSQYVNNTVDDIHKANGGKAEVKNIKCYRGVVEFDFNSALEAKPDFPLTAKFEKLVEFKSDDTERLKRNFVVRSWPGPRKSWVLRRKDRKLFYEDIIPGTGEVLKSWTLLKKRESIHIDLYVSSGNNLYSFYRFLSIGSQTTHAKLPFEKCPLHLGQYSAMHVSEDHLRYLWVYYNVVFDVTFTNVTFKPGKLVKWFNRIARCRLKIKKFSKPNLHKYLPSTADIQFYVNNGTAEADKETMFVKINDTITVTLKAQKNLLYDFTYETGDGLQLLSKTTKEMKFRVIKVLKEDNKLAVVVVDKKTLLCSIKVFCFRQLNIGHSGPS